MKTHTNRDEAGPVPVIRATAPDAAIADTRVAASALQRHQQLADASRRTAQLKQHADMAAASPAAIARERYQQMANERQPNRTGLPDRLKSGLESLSGMRMDHVKVHYNSDKPAQLQAHAYAQGNEIHVGPGQERHLPHEAWHVVQQTQGRVKPTLRMKSRVSINDDRGLESEADAMGTRAQALGQEQSLPREAPDVVPLGTPSPVAQRVIIHGSPLPTTWKKIPEDSESAAADIMQRVHDQLGDEIDAKKLEQIWNKLAKDANLRFDLGSDKDADALVAAIVKRYRTSMKYRQAYERRDTQAQALVKPLLDAHANLSFVPSARNPMVVDEHIHEVDFDEDEGNMGAQRAATHASTLIRSLHPSGEESQASFRRDGMGMAVSTNSNAENDLVRGELKVAQDLKKLAARILTEKKIESMSREDAMQNVVVRHALKLYDRISDYLASDAQVNVPSNVLDVIDGLHAEIRIVYMKGWDQQESYPPTGTMYPCMGCYLHLHGKDIEIGRWMGPMWVTNAALAKQLEALLRKNLEMGKFPAKELEAVAQEVRVAYDGLPPTSQMGKGKFKSGKSGYERRADSDDEYSDGEYERLQQRVVAHHRGTPMSPQWLGASEGWEPKESSSGLPETETPQDRFDRGLAPMTREEARKLMERRGMKMIDFVKASDDESTAMDL
jgi:hypothetical protein